MPRGMANSHMHATKNLRLPLPQLAEIPFCAGDSELCVLSDEALFATCGTRIAFTTRAGGVSEGSYAGLNLSYSVGDDAGCVDANRRLLCAALDAGNCIESLISPLQVHGSDFIEIRQVVESQLKTAGEADGIVCVQSEIPVLLCFADCVPVILVAPDGSFAVIHSGWRGSIAGIAGKGLRKLQLAARCAASDINCYIGPHIGPCCYEVSAELVGQFVAEFGESCDAGNNHLDLSAAVIASLTRAGAAEDRIADAGVCTSCHHDAYYSYRADAGVTGRHGAFAIRKEES